MIGQKLFRQKALAKLSSPEQLDQLIIVTDPRGWIALTSVILILSGMIVWLIMGTVPTIVNSQGIILGKKGLYSVTSRTSGSIIKLNVALGDYVEENQVIANICNPEVRMFDLQLQQLEEHIRDLKEDKENLEKNTKLIVDLELERTELNIKRQIYSEIISPIKGRVIDILNEGTSLKSDERVAIIEPLDEKLDTILYVPLNVAKKISSGMKVQISPSVAQKETYGFIYGTVAYVHEYPATMTGIKTILISQMLVDMFTNEGAVVEIRVDMDEDPSTVSGYKWSNGKGPPFKISNGTLCRAVVILNENHPINLMAP